MNAITLNSKALQDHLEASAVLEAIATEFKDVDKSVIESITEQAEEIYKATAPVLLSNYLECLEREACAADTDLDADYVERLADAVHAYYGLQDVPKEIGDKDLIRNDLEAAIANRDALRYKMDLMNKWFDHLNDDKITAVLKNIKQQAKDADLRLIQTYIYAIEAGIKTAYGTAGKLVKCIVENNFTL